MKARSSLGQIRQLLALWAPKKKHGFRFTDAYERFLREAPSPRYVTRTLSYFVDSGRLLQAWVKPRRGRKRTMKLGQAGGSGDGSLLKLWPVGTRYFWHTRKEEILKMAARDASKSFHKLTSQVLCDAFSGLLQSVSSLHVLSLTHGLLIHPWIEISNLQASALQNLHNNYCSSPLSQQAGETMLEQCRT